MANEKRLCREPTSGLVPIDVPPDLEHKAERAVRQLETYEAACLWCGHGYTDYSARGEDEHFAHNCSDAPKELKENAKRRLMLGDYDDDCCESKEERGGSGESR